MVDFKVISTGSKGNCVILNDEIAIDMGVPYSAVGPCSKGLRLVLLSHAHGDHFKPSTARRLAAERPAIRWATPSHMAHMLVDCGISGRNIDIISEGLEYEYGTFKIESFPLVHDVQNTGWKIHLENGESILYATDTGRIDHVEAPGYDLYLLEANYAEGEVVERIRRKQAAGDYVHEWAALDNHLSREKALDWLYRNMGPRSEYVLLHEHEEKGDRLG